MKEENKRSKKLLESLSKDIEELRNTLDQVMDNLKNEKETLVTASNSNKEHIKEIENTINTAFQVQAENINILNSLKRN